MNEIDPSVLGLGRRPEFDPRSRRFNVREVIGTPYARSYTWGCEAWLDQGSEGACVGFAWAHEANAKPSVQPVAAPTAMALYRAAQKIDEWPGEAYSGTSVLAGAKVSMTYGWLKEYRWAFNVPDALSAISRKGPAVIGVNWYNSFYYPEPDGSLRIYGDIVGGHAILVRGTRLVFQPGTTTAQKQGSDWFSYLDQKASAVLLHNSWGKDWGGTTKGPGTAWLPVEVYARLMSEQGECCVPVVRTAGA
jgi:hypothetical protein